MLSVDLTHALPFLPQGALAALEPELAAAHELLASRQGLGAGTTGWLRLPADYDRAELDRIRAAAEQIRSQSRVLVVIGIGGSYLGARAVLELLRSPWHNLLPGEDLQVFFAGNNLSDHAAAELTALLEGKDFSINVISKSGTTTEPAIAFRLFRDLLECRCGKEEARRRIYATTDGRRGALRTLAEAEGYECFTIPEDIGGRWSVLTAVGLLPLAAAGVDIDRLLAGAAGAMETLDRRSLDNPAWQYAGVRNLLYREGKQVELLSCFEPGFRFLGEWWKQLFGESEGKDGRGLFPASAEFSADLHSMGQYIQEGRRLLFETLIRFETCSHSVTIPDTGEDGDQLAYLAGKPLSFVRRQAELGAILAHGEGGVPAVLLELPRMDEAALGALLYFFQLSCALSGYVLGVNPFDQPGVEAYKRNMFALLGKPGCKELRAKLLSK